jgi:hypothetical protein
VIRAPSALDVMLKKEAPAEKVSTPTPKPAQNLSSAPDRFDQCIDNTVALWHTKPARPR